LSAGIPFVVKACRASLNKTRSMGIWKAQISIRIRQDLRSELEAFAERERRKLGNIGEVLLEWAFEQLKIAGSTERLLKSKVGSGGPRQGSRKDS
jgi:hypothetical protein